MQTEQVTASNAYRFSDNFAIVATDETGTFYGCEHNHEEADAIARYLSNRSGRKIAVVRNGVDQVRAAREIRGNDVVRVKHRDMILKDMGIWE